MIHRLVLEGIARLFSYLLLCLDYNLAEKIAKLRKEKGLTQSQLAEVINVSNKTISRWETGEGYPEITLLMPLSKALGVTTDYLLGITQDQDQDQDQGQAQTADNAAGRGSQETPQASGPRYYTGQNDVKPRKHADRPAERFSFHPAQLLRCYRSLTIFNKIGAWTAALALLLPLFGLMLLPHASLLMQLYPLVIMGSPCPNLGTGTFNHHGVTEFANIRQMNQCVELIKELLTIQ